MKKKICLVIVAYPGKLTKIRNLIDNNQNLNLLVFFNNFKKKPILKNINECFYFNTSITISRIEMIKILKKLNYDYYIFHDVDDKYNKKRPNLIKKYFNKYDFVINDIKTIYKNKYFSTRIKNKQILNFKLIKNYNFAGMTNSACSRNILKKIKFYKTDYKAPIFDWMFCRKIFKKGNGIFVNETISFYDVNKKSATFLPTNFQNKNNLKIGLKIRKYFGLKGKSYMVNQNNFWWEV